MELSGIWPVLPTPFNFEGEVDPAAMRKVVRFALSAGASGVVFPGPESEIGKLSLGERGELLQAVVEEAGEPERVVAGSTAETTRAVQRSGKQASDLGIGLMMVQPPLRLGRNAELIVSFMKSLAEALPGMSFILQNAPLPQGSGIPPETLVRIAEQVPEIAYVKDETIPLGAVSKKILENCPLSVKGIIGSNGARLILEDYASGACAAMPTVEIVDLYAKLDAAWRGGRKDEATALYESIGPYTALQIMYRMALAKHVLSRRGVLRNSTARVRLDFDAGGMALADRHLERWGMVSDADGEQSKAA